MKRIAIVAAHFPPSNLTGVHRARLWAQHLPEFGWEPTIVTTHPDYYEEPLDLALLALVDPKLKIIRTRALPVKPVRLVGDLGIRAFYWHYKALDRLIRRREIDFVHITIPSNYSALLGAVLYRRHQFPFGIDYIDPWVMEGYPGAAKLFSKAWFSSGVAEPLERLAVKNVSLITGVASSYYEAVLKRNPHLVSRCVTAAMPYGHSDLDYQMLRDTPQETFLFPRNDGLFHMIYAGAMLPKAYAVLERLFEALALLRHGNSETMKRLRIHFVGTGKSPSDPTGYNIKPYIERFGLEEFVQEHPHRIGYTDVLNHLVCASATLILGSTEAHYTPSKVFQAVQAKKPIFALLHDQSSAVGVLRESRAGCVVTLRENRLPLATELAATLSAFVSDPQYSADAVRWDAFESYSARSSARALACAVDQARDLFELRGR